MYSEKALSFASNFCLLSFKVDIISAQYYMNDEDVSSGPFGPRGYAGCLGIGAKDPFSDNDKVLSISFTVNKDWYSKYNELILNLKHTPPNNKKSEISHIHVVNKKIKSFVEIGVYKKEGFDDLYQFTKKHYQEIEAEADFYEFIKNNQYYDIVIEKIPYNGNKENLLTIEREIIYKDDPFLSNVTINIIVSDIERNEKLLFEILDDFRVNQI